MRHLFVLTLLFALALPGSALAKTNINAAPASELAKVPGFDPQIAARIVARRAARGPFRSLDELLEIQGVTKMTMDSAADHVEISPAPAPAPAASGKKLDLNKARFAELLR